MAVLETKEKEKKAKKKEKLKEMINKITPENKHKEIKWGKPIGKEIW